MIRMSIVQMESLHLEPERNLSHMEAWISAEAAEGVDLIVFPELATTGYLEPITPDDTYNPAVTGHHTQESFMDSFKAHAEGIPGPSTDRIAKLAKTTQTYVIFGMLEAITETPGLYANTVVLIGPDGVMLKQRKLHLPWNEKMVFVQGTKIETASVRGIIIGINVCYDAYFPEVSRGFALKGAHLIVSCFAGPKHAPEDDTIPLDRASFLSRTRALENSLYFASVNKVGCQGIYQFIGNSAIAGPNGELVAATDSLKETAVRAVIDSDRVVSARKELSALKDRRPMLYKAMLD